MRLTAETLGLGREGLRRGRPGLAGSAPSGLVAVGFPAANSLSRIFVRIGNGLNGPTLTIPDSMPGSLDCAAGDCNPLLFRRHHLPKQWRREPFYGLRNSSYHRNATHAGQQDFRRRSPVRPSSGLKVAGGDSDSNLGFRHISENKANIIIFSACD